MSDLVKIKVSDLTLDAIDFVVAGIYGWTEYQGGASAEVPYIRLFQGADRKYGKWLSDFNPSQDDKLVMDIIREQKIGIQPNRACDRQWEANMMINDVTVCSHDTSPAAAAMRCLLIATYGHEVVIPRELLGILNLTLAVETNIRHSKP